MILNKSVFFLHLWLYLSISHCLTFTASLFSLGGDTETQRQLDSINQRYEDLKLGLTNRVDDLELTKQYIEKDAEVVQENVWAKEMENTLESAKPQSEEPEDLEKEVMQLQVRGILWFFALSSGLSNVICNCTHFKMLLSYWKRKIEKHKTKSLFGN